MTAPSPTTVVLYAFDTMADWEYGHLVGALAQLREMGVPLELQVTGDSADEIRTLGGLRLRPDHVLADLDEDRITALVLPGGNTWDTGHRDVLELARRLLERGRPVAAICGATLGLARSGLLNDRAHTSNAPEFLRVDGYGGGGGYTGERVVVDGPLITAPATGFLEFTREILRATGLMPDAAAEAWFQMHRTGDRAWEGRLAESFGEPGA